MTPIAMQHPVCHPVTGAITTIAAMADTGEIVFRKVDNMYKRGGGARTAYFADFNTPDAPNALGWEIRQKAFESRTAKGATTQAPQRVAASLRDDIHFTPVTDDSRFERRSAVICAPGRVRVIFRNPLNTDEATGYEMLTVTYHAIPYKIDGPATTPDHYRAFGELTPALATFDDLFAKASE